MRLGVSSRVAHPDVCVGAKGCLWEGPHAFNSERDEIEFSSLPSLRILKEFIKRRVAAFLEVLIRLQPATSSLLASVVDSDRSFCTFKPCPKIECVYANAKHIRRDKAILRRVQPDHTDDETVDA